MRLAGVLANVSLLLVVVILILIYPCVCLDSRGEVITKVCDVCYVWLGECCCLDRVPIEVRHVGCLAHDRGTTCLPTSNKAMGLLRRS